MNNNLIISKGKLHFDPVHHTKKHENQGEWKKTAIIMLNDDTYQYYQWFIQKRFPFIQGVLGEDNWMNPPLRGSHVTIINDRINDDNLWNKIKEKYDGEELHFFFNWDGLRTNGQHWFFKVECPMGQAVRDYGNLGFPYFGLHLTIGLVPKESKLKRRHSENVYEINKRYGLWEQSLRLKDYKK